MSTLNTNSTGQNGHKTYRMNAKLFGVFFVLTFLCYGIGSSMIELLVSAPDVLVQVSEHVSQLVIGAILMAVLHTVLNIMLPVLMLPVLKQHSPVLAYAYLSLAIAATITLIIGVIFLLLMIPLSANYMGVSVELSEPGNVQILDLMTQLLKQGGFYAYQIGMAIWGLGGLLLCLALFNFKQKQSLVPKWLLVWGMIGYLIFITGTLFELFGFEYGLMMSMPGGLFELFLSGWLIKKGFNQLALVN
ncbi:MAG: DUF4386 domain-containing protein [Saccharospirillaceae bacterium]|nr:DUF4386 domain-containing protein [Pseudomonadales bacterium]NRB77798.1 DUF4386 domain-containing protein [Saccharospirillaceae bacterium]